MDHRSSQKLSGGKKRKCEVDLDAERNLYHSFVSAANSISQLYTHSVQQQRKGTAGASRQTLERVMRFLVREYHSVDVIPRAELLQFLQQEYENIEGAENLPHQFPVPVLPVVASGPCEADSPAETNVKPRAAHCTVPRRSGSTAMDTADQPDAPSFMNL
eukprot:gene22713-29874_t